MGRVSGEASAGSGSSLGAATRALAAFALLWADTCQHFAIEHEGLLPKLRRRKAGAYCRCQSSKRVCNDTKISTADVSTEHPRQQALQSNLYRLPLHFTSRMIISTRLGWESTRFRQQRRIIPRVSIARVVAEVDLAMCGQVEQADVCICERMLLRDLEAASTGTSRRIQALLERLHYALSCSNAPRCPDWLSRHKHRRCGARLILRHLGRAYGSNSPRRRLRGRFTDPGGFRPDLARRQYAEQSTPPR